MADRKVIVKEINRDYVLQNVIACVENYDRAVNNCKERPFIYFKYEDLAEYWMVLINDKEGFRVTKKALEYFNITIEELIEAGRANTVKEITVNNLGEKLYGESEPELPDVVTNTHFLFGASAILFKGKIAELCKKHNTKYCYIIPSSIHEILIMYTNRFDENNKAYFDNMVNEVNEKELAEHERLSNHCYMFYADTMRFEY